jgi:hypothetical protein
VKGNYEWELSIKGGPGSGHWGHAGRPGLVGGSTSGSVAVSVITGRTAAVRQEIRKDPQRGIGWVSKGKDVILVKTPYSADFVSDLKSNINYAGRKWNDIKKRWEVEASERNQKIVDDLVSKYFHRVDQSGWTSDQTKQVSKYLRTVRNKANQDIIKQHSDELRSEINDLDQEIASYSYSSTSRHKQRAITRRALLEYTLRDMNADPATLEEIQERSLAKVVREIGG